MIYYHKTSLILFSAYYQKEHIIYVICKQLGYASSRQNYFLRQQYLIFLSEQLVRLVLFSGLLLHLLALRNPNWRIICSWFGADASQMPGLIPGYVGCQPYPDRTPSLLLLSWSCSALWLYPPLLLYWSASSFTAVHCSKLRCNTSTLHYSQVSLSSSVKWIQCTEVVPFVWSAVWHPCTLSVPSPWGGFRVSPPQEVPEARGPRPPIKTYKVYWQSKKGLCWIGWLHSCILGEEGSGWYGGMVGGNKGRKLGYSQG